MVSNFKLKLADAGEVESVSLLEKFSSVSNLPAVIKEMLETPKPIYEVTPFREEPPKQMSPVLKKKKKASGAPAAAAAQAARAEEVNRLALEMLAKQKAAKDKKTRITKPVTSKGDYLNWMNSSQANKDYTPVKLSARGSASMTRNGSVSPLKSARKGAAGGKKKAAKPATSRGELAPPPEQLNLRIDTLHNSQRNSVEPTVAQAIA